MATREENLKKINEELEELDDEQLEQIAGGMKKNPKLFSDDNPNIIQIPLKQPIAGVSPSLLVR